MPNAYQLKASSGCRDYGRLISCVIQLTAGALICFALDSYWGLGNSQQPNSEAVRPPICDQFEVDGGHLVRCSMCRFLLSRVAQPGSVMVSQYRTPIARLVPSIQQ